MGRQQGIVYLTGQFGDLRLSINANGKPVVAFAPVRPGKVKKGSNYALTRKNNDEFTGSAVSAHRLRMCMGERIRQFADRSLSNRLMSVTRNVISQGPGRAGQRSFEVAAHVAQFKHLEANRTEPLNGRFQAPFSLTVNSDRNTVTLDIPGFDVDNFLYRPQGATDFRLLLVVGVLSNFVYTGGNLVYTPLHEDLDGLGSTVVSAALPAENTTVGNVQLVASVPGLPVLPATAGLVVSVGIEFLRVINNYEEVMASGNALRLVEVF